MLKLRKSYTTSLGCAVTHINVTFPTIVTIKWEWGYLCCFFRIFLLAIIFVVGAYTFPVVMDYGLLSLFPNFFEEIGQLNWQGQFNLDFFTFLLLSGFWLVWRNQFSPLGFVLGLGGVLLGAPYLALYFTLLWLARLAGLEPATLGLEGRCSIQLNYKRLCN